MSSQPRAVALLSGGLDSQLAVALMLEQGVEVTAVHYESPLCITEEPGCAAAARKAAESLGVPLVVVNTWRQILQAVNHPRHGHGKGVNPCIDCRIIHFTLARRLLDDLGADFIVSGEVLGQRPMSQHKRALQTIERSAGVEGLVLRPLSAHCLPPTIPEREGLVQRERLLGFQGRNRKPQMALAEEIGLEEYPSPAGGCVLTEPGFGIRYRRFSRYLEEAGLGEVDVARGVALMSGRHFVSTAGEWITLGRNAEENRRLMELADDVFSAVGRADDVEGPVVAVLAAGLPRPETLQQAADLVARYGQGRERQSVPVTLSCTDGEAPLTRSGDPQRGYELVERLERA